ncbi:TrmD tRNA-(guanine-N1)-methyltransferase [actinobacterium SCGC AAA044-D11]|uniref:tRNA (guanine-N(1)-)-methyltransferase n=1 Tax=freshwater metagenome TaxID=449393 RepID=A0A6J6BCR9_9ZZZZ|nr:tRNA (guanosine(37)-N1)-methyltransferase TrmD [Actinomycetota bacterium]
MSSVNRFDVITIFPDYLAPLSLSLIGKAQASGLISIGIHDLRDQTTDVHGSVDDTPYGGGAGMVMSPEPWGKAIDQVAELAPGEIHELIVLTPAGEKFTQELAQELTNSKHLIFACGRYEGIDVRVSDFYSKAKNFKVREVSIGDYVLGGGEVATLVIMEAIIRLIPGVIGNPASLDEESHTLTSESGVLVEYPNYTKPKEWRGLNVPDILLSGNHGEIAKWRLEQAQIRTKNRPS